MIRVLIVDDHPIVREGIQAILGHAPDILVIGEGKTGREAIHLTRNLSPDVLLLDMELPDISGIEVAEQLHRMRVVTRILALSSHTDRHYSLGLLSAGAAGYLTKDEAPARIVEAVRGVARGEDGWMSPKVGAHVLTHLRHEEAPPVEAVAPERLTEREQEVLAALAEGFSNKQIAARLSISPHTVAAHIRVIIGKFGVTSRHAAIRHAQHHHLI